MGSHGSEKVCLSLLLNCVVWQFGERHRAVKSLQATMDSKAKWKLTWASLKENGQAEIEEQLLRFGSDHSNNLSERNSRRVVRAAISWLQSNLPVILDVAISLPFEDFVRLTERLIQDRTGAMEASVPRKRV